MWLLVAGVVVLAAVAGACSSNPDQTVGPPPVPSRDDAVVEDAVVIDGFPSGGYGSGMASGLVATGSYVEFRADGSGRLRGLGFDSGFTYVIDDDRIEVTAVPESCEAGPSGTYRWSAGAAVLRLTDPVVLCDPRWDRLLGDWYPLGDVPVVTIDPDGDPVTIDSPIGPIDWQFVVGQAYAWAVTDRPVVAVDGGFVAVVDARADQLSGADQLDGANRALAFSQDGIDWRSIPPPPSTVALIAADGERLYVAPSHLPDAVCVTTDRGGTWRALEVEDPPVAVSGLYAGPAGVALTGSGTAVWLLGDDSFERVADTPEPLVDVLVLDTGFFALSVVELDAHVPDDELRSPYPIPSLRGSLVSYWYSEDGRTWTRATDVPADMPDLTNRGDNVYVSSWGDGIGYTSTDGGRTWSSLVRRPGGGLTVTDAGYFSVGTLAGVVWVSSDDVDWQRVVNPWPPLWTFDPVISGDTVLVPGELESPVDGLTHLDLVGHID